MKRNLFAMFLAVALVVALVFVVAPSAKAESYTFTETDREFSISEDSILDMAGFSGKVTLSNGAKLTVYDSGNTSKTGENVAQLTVEGDGSVEKITLQNGYRYLKVENTNGTYSFHPFNMAFTHIGLNTKTNSVCVRAAFIANDVVKAKLTDYGIYSTVHEEYASCAEKYPFNNANGVYAYYDFVNSFGEEDIDSTKSVKLYMTVDGETVETDYTASFIPREVLKKINKVGPTIANEPQLDRITDMIDGNDRIANILLNFLAEPSTDTISFANQNALVSSSTTEQIWKQGGVKLTYAKSTSTTNLVLNTNPARFYANTMVTIDALNITEIVFDCNTSDYAKTLNASIGTVSGASVSVSSDKVTVTFTNPVNSFVIKKMSAQVRVDAITVSASTAPSCAHMKDLSEATCTKKAICIDCDAEHGNTLPHVEKTAATCTAKATCVNCGNAYGSTLPHDTIATATCTTPAQCSVCGPYGSVDKNNHKDDNTDHICDYGCTVELGTHIDMDGDTVCDYGCDVKIEAGEVTLIDKTYTYSFSSKQYSANGTKTLGGVNWTLAGNGGYWGYDNKNGKGQQFGSSGTPFKSLTFTSAEFKNVSKITINTSGASSVNASFTVWVGGVQVGSSTKLTKTATTYTFEVPEGTLLTGAVEFRYTQTSSKAIYIKSISVDYAEPA